MTVTLAPPGNGACQAAAHNISGDGAAIDVNMRVSSNGGGSDPGIGEDAAHDLMVEGAGVDHNVYIPLDIRGIGADHRGGITAGEGAEGGVFRREFQINVSGDAGRRSRHRRPCFRLWRHP